LHRIFVVIPTRTVIAQGLQLENIMTTFRSWTDLVHTKLETSIRRAKRSHIQEILAAAFGHRTYASFRVQDLEAVNSGNAKYLLLDDSAALERAAVLGLVLSAELWNQAKMTLSPSGISRGAWFTDFSRMENAANLVFEHSNDEQFVRIWQKYGQTPQGRRVPYAPRKPEQNSGALPDTLTVVVNGEQVVQGYPLDTVVPVTAVVRFQLVARRGYAKGELSEVLESGALYVEEPEEIDGDVYGPLSEN
jgi:hypothetical protein